MTVQVVAPFSPSVFLVDMDGVVGDTSTAASVGVDLGGQINTGAGTYAWTRPGTKDAFLEIDASLARTLGYELSISGTLANDIIRLSSGLVIRDTFKSVSITTGSALQAVEFLDSDRDGVLTLADRVAPALYLFTDSNGNGIPEAGERIRIAQSNTGQESMKIVFKVNRSLTDAYGNALLEVSAVTVTTLGTSKGLGYNASLRRY